MVRANHQPRQVDLGPFVSQPHPVEPQLKALLSGIRCPVIFDIGANEGEDTLRYLRLFPNARIHAFEPLPGNQRLLHQNIIHAAAKGIKISSLALSNRKGTSVFHVSSGEPPVRFAGDHWNYGNKSSSLLPPRHETPMHGWIRFKEHVEVETDTLDAYCSREGVQRIDWMHIDVQGAERMVLEGGQNILCRTRAVWMEVMCEELYSGQALRPDLEKIMESLGFVPLANEERGTEADVLFVNKRFPVNRLIRFMETTRNHLKAKTRKLKEAASSALTLLGFRVLRSNHPFVRFLDDPPCTALMFALHRAFPSLHGLTFIQVGANDGVRSDPLCPIIHRWRWRGVQLEPHPVFFSQLQGLAREGIQQIQAAVSERDGQLTLYYLDLSKDASPDWANGLATTDRHRIESEAAQLGLTSEKIRSLDVPCLSWESLLKQSGIGEPDVLCLDTEGMDVELLRLWNWKRHLPRLVHFEHACLSEEDRADFYQELWAYGYEISTDGPDTTAYLNRDSIL